LDGRKQVKEQPRFHPGSMAHWFNTGAIDKYTRSLPAWTTAKGVDDERCTVTHAVPQLIIYMVAFPEAPISAGDVDERLMRGKR